jgi:hypothetical protein
MRYLVIFILSIQISFAAKLTPSEQQTLGIGETTPMEYLGGGVLAWAPGFGVGHAVQGRWADKGWIFTVGQIFSAVFIMIEVENFDCDDPKKSNFECYLSETDNKFAFGAVSFSFFKIWEIWDAWVGGFVHMDDYDSVQRKIKSNRDVKISAPNSNSLLLSYQWSF